VWYDARVSGLLRTVAGLLLVATSCGAPVSDPSPSDDERAPALPTPAWAAGGAAGTDAPPDADPDEGAEADEGADAAPDASDAPSDTADGDAKQCPLSRCEGAILISWVHGKLWCHEVTETCMFGCAEQGGVAACLPPDAGACGVGELTPQSGLCPYRALGLCFQTFDEACKCLGCTAPSCQTYKLAGRLKIPKCLKPSCLASSDAAPTDSGADDASSDDATSDASSDGASSDASSDSANAGDASSDATDDVDPNDAQATDAPSGTLGVACK